MSSPSLDRFYNQIDKSIKLIEKYTEIKNSYKLFKACRLKPEGLIFGKKEYSNNQYKTKLYRSWFDEFGNLVKLPVKKIYVVYNHLDPRYKNIVSTDLYYGISIDKIAKISKFFHLIIGLDEDEKDNYIFITFLGIDDYFRSYMFIYNEWHHVSPLILGIPKVRSLFNYEDIKYFHQLKFKKNNMIPCDQGTEWISCLPVPESLLEIIKKKYEIDFSFLKYEE